MPKKLPTELPSNFTRDLIPDNVLWPIYLDLYSRKQIGSSDKCNPSDCELVRAFCGERYTYVPLHWIKDRLITLRKRSRTEEEAKKEDQLIPT